MKNNIFQLAFEMAFKNELDLTKDANERYTDPHAASVFHTYVNQILAKLVPVEEQVQQ
jgi:hypothetical protein